MNHDVYRNKVSDGTGDYENIFIISPQARLLLELVTVCRSTLRVGRTASLNSVFYPSGVGKYTDLSGWSKEGRVHLCRSGGR